MDVNSRIKEIIAEECFLKPNLITDEALFETLGVDSLARIEIWMRIGQEFEVEIPDLDSGFWEDHKPLCLKDIVSTLEDIRRLAIQSETAHAADNAV